MFGGDGGSGPGRDEILARALAYPFPRPPASVLIDRGAVRPLTALAPELVDGRTPLLAYGSNASPASLGWKFPDARDAVVPLVRGAMSDLDVVYSSHVAVYGSIPATLQRSPGTVTETFVAFVTGEQLELVAGWEINADYETLAVDLELEVGDPPPVVGAFVSRHGCLTSDGSEIAVAEVAARGRRFREMTQPEVIDHARARVAPGLSREDFVVGNVRDYERARAYTAELRRSARPFEGSRRGDSNP
jgi:hypothetical protein